MHKYIQKSIDLSGLFFARRGSDRIRDLDIRYDQVNELSEIYRKQPALPAKYEKKLAVLADLYADSHTVGGPP
jgi:hypothetical protein